MIGKDTFYKYQENRAQIGYKCAFLVRFPQNTYYEMLIASETIPDIVGDQETFEFDLLNSPVKGKVVGKKSIEDANVDFLYHRDNAYRLEQVKDVVLDMATITGEFVVRKFIGTISYNENEFTNDIVRGTMKITAMTASDSPMLNGRELDIRESLCFGVAIPESIKQGDKIVLKMVQESTTVPVTYKEFTISGEDNIESEKTTINKDTTSGKYTLTNTGLVGIEASAEGYASWYTTVYVYPTTQTQTAQTYSNFKL